MSEQTAKLRFTRASETARRNLLFTIALIGVVGCTTATEPAAIASLTLTPGADSVEMGAESNGYVVTVFDGSGNILTGRRVEWRSANEAIATVDGTGKVHGVALGQTVITATAGGQSANANVKVILPLTQILLTPQSADVALTTTRQFTAQLVGPGGEAITGRVITWSSGNTSIVAVSATGLVTAVGLGTTQITASAGSKTATATVRVTGEPVAQVRITPQAPVQVVRLAQTFQLAAGCYNSGGVLLTGRTINWSSSNPSVATVTTGGLVSGLSLGFATVTAECEGRTAQIGIQVSAVPVGSVSITPSSLTVTVGTQQQLSLTVRDTANNVIANLQSPFRFITWTSDNLPIATVSQAGVVSGFSAGTANVQVTVDGVTSAPITVTVQNVPVATVQVTAPVTPATVKVGSSIQLGVILRDTNGNVLSNAGRQIQWISSDASVASVSSGLVTGVTAGGPITIEAITEGKIGSISITVVP